MLSFIVYTNGQLTDKLELSSAYVVGTDDVPLRAEITFTGSVIQCKKRASGPAGLALLWDVSGVGTFLLETIRVQEREQPYILQVELARGRLMRINNKLEDWGLLEFEGAVEINARITQARELLIKALQADTPEEAAIIGDESLSLAVQASEALSMLHSYIFLERRKHSEGFSPQTYGCSIHPDKPKAASHKSIAKGFDFATIPFSWRDIEPAEQSFNWQALDEWVALLAKHKIPMRGSSLLTFNENNVPDWLYIWEHDFDTIRDLAFDHVRRIVNRYSSHIQTWTVISGIHASNCFTFNFDQLMELTRMSAALTKQLCPNGTTILEMVCPWGEYYAHNQRTIPPLLYADMVIQSAVNVDAFGLQMMFGKPQNGMFVRDMFQISCVLDQFSKLSKPLHLTAVQVPSDTMLKNTEHPDAVSTIDAGTWHEPWNEQTQAQWLEAFVGIALSKPYIESVTWHELADHTDQLIPHGGLLRSDDTPKKAYEKMIEIRKELTGRSGK